jgi:hypothetical protein
MMLPLKESGMGVPMAEEWKNLYHVAILETDWSKIEGRIQAANSALNARLHEFSLNHGGTPEENQAIRGALNALSVLRDEVVADAKKRQIS